MLFVLGFVSGIFMCAFIVFIDVVYGRVVKREMLQRLAPLQPKGAIIEAISPEDRTKALFFANATSEGVVLDRPEYEDEL